jgi:hypothetical protein
VTKAAPTIDGSICTLLNSVFFFAAAVCVVACSGNPSDQGQQQAAALDPSRLKSLISEAAAIDRGVWDSIGKAGGYVDPSFIVEKDGETLTCHMILITPPDPKSGEQRFIQFSPTVDPALLAEAIDPGVRGTGLSSIQHPEYIRDLEWEVSGEAVKGAFAFEAANGAYRRRAKFVARFSEGEDSDMYISAFDLDSEGVRIERGGPTKKWKRASIPIAP